MRWSVVGADQFWLMIESELIANSLGDFNHGLLVSRNSNQ